MYINKSKNLAHTVVVGFAVLLVVSTAAAYGIIKDSPLPTQKSVAGANETIEKPTNQPKKQRNQTNEEYMKISK